MRNVDLPFHMQPMWTDNPTSNWRNLDPFEIRHTCFGGDGDGDGDGGADGQDGGLNAEDTSGAVTGHNEPSGWDDDSTHETAPTPAAVGVVALDPVDPNYADPNYSTQLDARNDQLNTSYAGYQTDKGGWFDPSYTYDPNTDTFSSQGFGQKVGGFLGSQIPGLDVNISTKGLTAGNMLDPPDEIDSTIDRSFDPFRAFADVAGAWVGGNFVGSGLGSKLAGKVGSTVSQAALDAVRGQFSLNNTIQDLTGNLISVGGFKAAGPYGEKAAGLLSSHLPDLVAPREQTQPDLRSSPSPQPAATIDRPEPLASPDLTPDHNTNRVDAEPKSESSITFGDYLPDWAPDFIRDIEVTTGPPSTDDGSQDNGFSQQRSALNLSNAPVSTGGAASPIVATEIADTNVATSDAAVSPQASAGALPSGVGYVLPVRNRSFGSQAYNNASPFGSRMLERRSGLGGNVIRV